MPVGLGWTRAGTNKYKSTPGRVEVPPVPGEEWVAVGVPANIGEMSFVCVNRYLLRAEWSYLSTTGCLTLFRLFRLLAYLNYACMSDPLP